MNEIEELYDFILSNDFDDSILDKFIDLVKENTKEKISDKVITYLETTDKFSVDELLKVIKTCI